MNASKRSLVLDLDSDEGLQDLAELARASHVVYLERGSAMYERHEFFREQNPALVVTSVSPFGRSGPLADAPASDLTLQAAGGIAWMSGRPDAPPLRLPFNQSEFVAAVYSASATAAALLDAERTGRGHDIDVSAQECIAHSLQNAIQVWDLEGRISKRGGEGTRDATENIFPCKDGYVFLAAARGLGVSWPSIVEWAKDLNHPVLVELERERWADRKWRLGEEARLAFCEAFTSLISEYTKDELLTEAIRRHIVMSPVNSISDLHHDRQLQYRQFFQTVEGNSGTFVFPGAPYKLSHPVWGITAAPELGADNLAFETRVAN